ncbi:MAG TPA: hypothetical protein VFX19_11135 [Dehalococcoidia bacterium]|nr:hypothetical protein [Dehalococcoidia bacterium]
MRLPRGTPTLLAGVVIGGLLAYALVVTAVLVFEPGKSEPSSTSAAVQAPLDQSQAQASPQDNEAQALFSGPLPPSALTELPCSQVDDDHERHDVSTDESSPAEEDYTLDSEWLEALCTFEIQPASEASAQLDIGLGETAVAELQEVPLFHFPGLVDSNSPLAWIGDKLVAFNSRAWPTFSYGADLADLSPPESVEMYEQNGDGGRWFEAVWLDPESSILYGWYHREPDDLSCLTAPVIGAAISYDYGATWLDQGTVLEDPYPLDCDYENGYFSGGNGDFSVIVDTESQYFYFLYSNYGGPLYEQGIGIARSAFADRGQPGTAYKWDGVGWDQPGIGGVTYAVIPAATSWAGPDVDAFWGPSVHWNTYLQRYVALLNRSSGPEWAQEGVYVSFSSDLLTWTIPHKLLDTNSWYPQVVGEDPGDTDTLAGQASRLFVGGISVYALEFVK